MNLLPQVSSENLDQRYLESWNFAMHEDSSEIELHLEAHVDIGPIDCWRPPKSESPIWYLIQPGPLGMRQFLVFH